MRRLLSILAVPLLYLLSVPWVSVFQAKWNLGQDDSDVRRTYELFYGPWDWVFSNAPFIRSPMHNYMKWCHHSLGCDSYFPH